MRLSRLTLPAILSLLTVGFCPTLSHATTYVGGGGLINDVTVNTFDINVDDPFQITHFDSITFTGDHTYVGDLIFTLTHVETGTSVIFVDRVPSGSPINGTYTFVTNLASQTEDADSFWRAAFEASDGAPVASGTYAAAENTNTGGGGEGEGEGGGGPFTAAAGDGYTPTTFDVFNGQNVGGTWRLTIEDAAGQDSGNLNSWNFAISGTVVPEANSLALALPALGMVGGIAFYRRRK